MYTTASSISPAVPAQNRNISVSDIHNILIAREFNVTRRTLDTPSKTTTRPKLLTQTRTNNEIALLFKKNLFIHNTYIIIGNVWTCLDKLSYMYIDKYLVIFYTNLDKIKQVIQCIIFDFLA